jgi:hypothetical protein
MEHLYAILRTRFSCVSMILTSLYICIPSVMQVNIYRNHASPALYWMRLTCSTL